MSSPDDLPPVPKPVLATVAALALPDCPPIIRRTIAADYDADGVGYRVSAGTLIDGSRALFFERVGRPIRLVPIEGLARAITAAEDAASAASEGEGVAGG